MKVAADSADARVIDRRKIVQLQQSYKGVKFLACCICSADARVIDRRKIGRCNRNIYKYFFYKHVLHKYNYNRRDTNRRLQLILRMLGL